MTMKKVMKRVLVIAFVLVLSGSGDKGYQVGDTARDFALKSTDGRMVSMADYPQARGFIVIFDCNTCPYSKAYNERIIALNDKYAPLGFPLIAINPNDPGMSPGDSYEDMVKLAKKKNYKFPYLVDETQEITRTYGATNTPHTFVLKREGAELKVAYIGAIDNNSRDGASADKKYVEMAVDALLAGSPVATPRTKAIGCAVKLRPN
jgi:peroxiredoxin